MLRWRVFTALLCVFLMAGTAVPAQAGGMMTSRQTRAVGERFSLSVSGSFTGDYRWQCDGQIIGITNGSGNVCSVRAVRPGSG